MLLENHEYPYRWILNRRPIGILITTCDDLTSVFGSQNIIKSDWMSFGEPESRLMVLWIYLPRFEVIATLNGICPTIC
jgi:hypothetical protein